ncbi:MAG: hypothetical protein AB7I50_03080 [Vicinamibacterales bacterium]
MSVHELVANPLRFDGKVVRTIGFLSLEAENVALYPSEDAYDHMTPDAIWVELSPRELEAHSALARRYVVIKAIYRAGPKGHFGAYAGQLEQIADLRPTLSRKEVEKLTAVPPPPPPP